MDTQAERPSTSRAATVRREQLGRVVLPGGAVERVERLTPLAAGMIAQLKDTLAHYRKKRGGGCGCGDKYARHLNEKIRYWQREGRPHPSMAAGRLLAACTGIADADSIRPSRQDSPSYL